MSDSSYSTLIQRTPTTLTIASGGTLAVEGTLSVASGAVLSSASGNGTAAGTGVAATETIPVIHKTTLTLTDVAVTIAKNGSSTGGGGLKIYDFPEGVILPLGVACDLTIANETNGSWLASLGSAAADTGGTLTSTEVSFGPSTAATVSSGAGTADIVSGAAGVPVDGSATAADLYLNFALNADVGTGTTMTVNGTIVITWANLGDN